MKRFLTFNYAYIFFLFLLKSIYRGYSLEASQWGASNEYPQHMFSWRSKKIINIILIEKVPYLLLCIYFFLFFHKKVCCGYSSEVPHQGASNEYPQHMFPWRNKKKYQYILAGKKYLYNIWSYIFFLFLQENLCCGYQLESACWGDSKYIPKNMCSFLWENKKNIFEKVRKISIFFQRKQKASHL